MLYFAYGSNLSKDAMQKRAPSARPVIAAVLSQHRLTFESNEPEGSSPAFFANIRPHADSLVPGALYEIDEAGVTALDTYEDVARGVYERCELSVLRTDGKCESALSYRMPVREIRLGRPSEIQLRQIREGYADWGLDRRVLDAATRLIPSTRS
ncbi:MAG: gamma-glutamylcyclotransferase family protein [Vulcanimicrobiaceae bacterium]